MSQRRPGPILEEGVPVPRRSTAPSKIRLVLSVLLLSTAFAAATPASQGDGEVRREDGLEALRAYTRYLLEEEDVRGEALSRAIELDPTSAFLQVEAARRALENRDLEGAIEAAERAVELDPRSLEAHLLLGRIYARLAELGGDSQKEHVERAIEHMSAVTEIGAGSAEEETWRALAELYELQARIDPTGAEGSLDRALEAWRRVGVGGQGTLRRARLLLRLDRTEEAIGVLRAEVAESPGYLRARQLLAEALEAEGEWQEAVHQYESVLAADPENHRVRLRLARSLDRKGDRRKARRVLDELLERGAPEEVQRVGLYLSAELLEDMRLYPEAEGRLRDLVRRFPEDPDARYELARFLHDRGFQEEARAHLESLLEDLEGDRRRRGAVKAADLLVRQGRAEEAIDLLEAVLEDDPDDASAALGLIEAYQTLGAYRRAERLAARKRRQLEEPGTFWLLEGQTALMRGDLEGGRKVLAEYAEAQEGSPRALALVGVAYETAGRPDEAADWLGRAVKAARERVGEDGDGHADVRKLEIQRAEVLEQAGRRDEAGEILDRLEKARPDTMEVAAARVRLIHRPRRSYEEILGLARRLRDVRPGVQLLRVWEIDALMRLDRLEEAREALAEAQEEHPSVPGFEALAVELAARAGKRGEALRLARERVEGPGGDLPVVLLFADHLREGGAAREALDLLGGVGERFRGHPQWEFAMGVANERLGRIEDAVAHLERTIEADPTHHSAMNYLGYTMVEHGRDLGEARSLIERALELSPRSPAYLDSLGWALLLQGKVEAAAEPLETAARMVPEDPVVRMHLARLREEQGRLPEALEGYMQALGGGLDERLDETRDRLQALRERISSSGDDPALP